MNIVVTVESLGDGNTEVCARADRIYEQHVSSEMHRNSCVLRALRKAGVPVVGAISILSVEFGAITMTFDDDLNGGKFVYTWVGDTSKMVTPCPVVTADFPLNT